MSFLRPWLSTAVRAALCIGWAGGMRAMVMPIVWTAASPSMAFFSSGTLPEDKILPFVVKSGTPNVRWTSDEDQRLRDGVKKYGEDWVKVSSVCLPERGAASCRVRWTLSLDPKIKNGIWTAAEDARLKKLVGEYGEGRWTEIAKHMDGRSRVVCRVRWTRCIDPSLKHGPWSASEDAVLLKEYALHPNKWTIIKESLPGRSDKSIFHRHKSLTKPDPDYIRWTDAENQLLSTAVCKHGSREWSKVAEDVPGRNREQCKQKWIGDMAHKGKTKDAWSEEHDALLEKGVKELGTDKWAAIAAGIPGKSGMECKIRWERDVSRRINTDPWSAEEDAIIKRMREEGKNWDKIFHQLPGRGKDAIIQRCEELGCGIGEQWTEEQNAALVKALLGYEGKKRKSWNNIAEQVPGNKTAKQCRRRDKYNRTGR